MPDEEPQLLTHTQFGRLVEFAQAGDQEAIAHLELVTELVVPFLEQHDDGQDLGLLLKQQIFLRALIEHADPGHFITIDQDSFRNMLQLELNFNGPITDDEIQLADQEFFLRFPRGEVSILHASTTDPTFFIIHSSQGPETENQAYWDALRS